MFIEQCSLTLYCPGAGKSSSSSKEAPLHCHVQVVDTDGAVGRGDLRVSKANRAGLESWNTAAAVLPGADASEHLALWQKLYGAGVSKFLISVCDVALWDLHGRKKNLPVHALLGTKRRRVKAYRSSRFNVGTPEDYAAEALRIKEAGYHGYKIHPTHNEYWDEGRAGGDVEEDLRIYRRVREAVGPDFPLMADPFFTYSYDEALRVGRELEALNYLWFESPMFEGDHWIDRYAELARHLDIPICAPEYNDRMHVGRAIWFEKRATDMGRGDILEGGLTSLLEILKECRKRQLRMDMHLTNHYQLQLNGATDEEVIPFAEDYFWYGNPACDPPHPPQVDDQGFYTIPDTPGMGLDFDEEHIRKTKV